MTILQDLPIEVMHHILFMSSPIAVGTLACVSKHWKGVCENPEVWHGMYDRTYGGPMTESGYKTSVVKNYQQFKKIEGARPQLTWGISKGHHNLVSYLFATTKTDVNDKDETTGNTYLYLACQNGSLKLVKEVLALGAEVDTANKEDETPLQVAAAGGFSQVVSLLISRGAEIDLRDKNGRSALHKAAYHGRANVVSTLLQAPGINLELEEKSYGQTALHIACGRNHLEVVMLLLQAHVNINAVDQDGWTPLHLACYKGNTAVVSALLSRDINRDCKTTAKEDAPKESAVQNPVK